MLAGKILSLSGKKRKKNIYPGYVKNIVQSPGLVRYGRMILKSTKTKIQGQGAGNNIPGMFENSGINSGQADYFAVSLPDAASGGTGSTPFSMPRTKKPARALFEIFLDILGGQLRMPAGVSSPEGGLAGLFSGGFADRAVDCIKKVESSYSGMVEKIVSGNQRALESVSGLFGELERGGDSAAGVTGEKFISMIDRIGEGMGDYALRLGTLSGLAAKAFFALRTMNPFAASAASMALLSLGKMMGRLAFSFSGLGGSSSGSSRQSYGANGQSSPESTWRGPQVVNVYISGLKASTPYEVDRSLNRAGVDRELRQRIRELIRTGANPVPVN